MAESRTFNKASELGEHVENLPKPKSDDVSRRASEVLLNHENLSYGPSGFSGLLKSPYVFAAAFLASMGGFSFGYGKITRYAIPESPTDA